MPQSSLEVEQATGASRIMSAVRYSDKMLSLHEIEANYSKLSCLHDTGLKNLAPQLFLNTN